MSLDRSDVEKIAHLARLAIDDAAVPDYAKDLSEILEFVEQLQAADTRGIAPMAHPLDSIQRLRVDEVTETDSRAEYQKVAPSVEEGLYLVPKVIE